MFIEFAAEIVPADVAALVGRMVIAVFLGLHHVHQEPCQIEGIGRSADLVVDYTYCIMGLADIDHGLNKVLPVEAEYPCDPDDEILLKNTADSQLAVQLALAIDIQRRVAFIIRLPRSRALAVKHIVCAYIDHLGVDCFGCPRDIFRADRIDLMYLFPVFRRLCSVDICPRRAVDDHIGLQFFDRPAHRRLICDIHLNVRSCCHSAPVVHAAVNCLNIRANGFMGSPVQFIDNVVSKLSSDSCYKYSHVNTLLRAASRANSCAAASQ